MFEKYNVYLWNLGGFRIRLNGEFSVFVYEEWGGWDFGGEGFCIRFFGSLI